MPPVAHAALSFLRTVLHVEVVELDLSVALEEGTIVRAFDLSSEQVQFLLLAAAGFELTPEEHAIMRPAYLHLLRSCHGDRRRDPPLAAEPPPLPSHAP